MHKYWCARSIRLLPVCLPGKQEYQAVGVALILALMLHALW